MAIRVLGPDDAAAFRALRLQALSTQPTSFSSSLEEESVLPAEMFRARLATEGGNAVFGAFAGDRLVGMAGFLAGDRLKLRHSGTLWGLFIEESWRRRGLGAQLVGRVIAHATGRVRVLRARIVTDNERARQIYRQLGFIAYGIERRSIFADGAFHDDEMLALDLDSLSQGGGP